jgi:hypothetical protein
LIEPRGRDEVIDVDATVFTALAECQANSVFGYRRNRTLLRAFLKDTFERSKPHS